MTTDKSGMITTLEPGEAIVVGTNAQGHHAGGAAAFAHGQFGLEWGVGEGLSGQTYALPTMEGLDALQAAAERFISFASFNPNLHFYLTRVGCGIAGYSDSEVAPLFKNAPANVVLPEEWAQL